MRTSLKCFSVAGICVLVGVLTACGAPGNKENSVRLFSGVKSCIGSCFGFGDQRLSRSQKHMGRWRKKFDDWIAGQWREKVTSLIVKDDEMFKYVEGLHEGTVLQPKIRDDKMRDEFEFRKDKMRDEFLNEYWKVLYEKLFLECFTASSEPTRGAKVSLVLEAEDVAGFPGLDPSKNVLKIQRDVRNWLENAYNYEFVGKCKKMETERKKMETERKRKVEQTNGHVKPCTIEMLTGHLARSKVERDQLKQQEGERLLQCFGRGPAAKGYEDIFGPTVTYRGLNELIWPDERKNDYGIALQVQNTLHSVMHKYVQAYEKPEQPTEEMSNLRDALRKY